MCSDKNHSEAKITHCGIVKSVSDGIAIVELSPNHDCAGCAAASLCTGATEQMQVQACGAKQAMIGKRVEIQTGAHSHYAALGLYMGAPLLICVLAIALSSAAGCSEESSGAIGAAALAAWYAVLYIFRKRISKAPKFEIISLIN